MKFKIFFTLLAALALAAPVSAQHVPLLTDPGNAIGAISATGNAVTSTQHWANLTDATEVTMSVDCWHVGGNGVTLLLEYSPDGSTWTATGCSISISATGAQKSSTVSLPGAATTGVWLRAVSDGGSTGDYVHLYHIDVDAS